MDCDDSIRNDVVADVKQYLSKDVGHPVFYGYNKGYEQDISKPYKLKFFEKDYGTKGSWSIMQSVKLNYRKEKIHPYMWNHTNFVDKLKVLGIEKY